MNGMSTWKVRRAHESDRQQIARMMALLWTDATVEEHARELDGPLLRGSSGTLPVAILIAQDDEGSLLGFIEVGLRSHADGCDPVRPVGFVEGWFVHEEVRGRGVGRDLMRAAEDWAGEQGCSEMASDTWADNEGSQAAHLALGFGVVDRCVHFRKSIIK
jgi:aminoglycoside 6'-N-acetyltransferase I